MLGEAPAPVDRVMQLIVASPKAAALRVYCKFLATAPIVLGEAPAPDDRVMQLTVASPKEAA